MLPKTKKDILFVGLQLLLFIAFIIDIEFVVLPIDLPNFWDGVFLGLGISIFILSIAQLGHSLSPFPSPKSNSELVTQGIFKYIRHPIYTSIFIGMLAWSVRQHSLYQLIISFLILILFYFKSRYEEQLLCEKFKEYKNYRRKTGRFFPKIF